LTRFLRLLGFALGVAFLILAVLAAATPWVYAHAILNPGCQGDRASLESAGFPSEPVEFPAKDGSIRRGWFSRGSAHPEIVIVVVTGHAGNTVFALPDAATAARAGYSTLIYEHRSCSDSDLIASTGVYEADDLLSAVAYLDTRPDVHHIGVWGYSEGGTAALLAAPGEPRIDAIVAMGGYSSLENDIYNADQPAASAFDRLVRQGVAWSMSAQIGRDVATISPLEVIHRIGPRPLLLIYGSQEIFDGQLLLEAAGDSAELWVVPGAGHGQYRVLAPEEYERRAVAFFDAAFDLP
jgi:fermentation-respiration switch protein FrsA (DUF1100 family)